MKHFLIYLFVFFTIQLSAQWSQTAGPGGGTINCIYETDGTYYSGADAVYSSSDGGLNWSMKNKGLPLTSKVNSVYSDDTFLYAGLTNFGVFRSDDLGESWMEINNGISENSRWINDVYEQDGILYACSNQGGVYISSDQGDNWTLKDNGLQGGALRVASITIFHDTLFIATPEGVYSSINNGDLWVSSSLGIPIDKIYSFDIVKNSSNLFVAALDGIYRSGDAGLSWLKVGDNIFSTGVYSITIMEEELYAGTNGKVFHSTNEGDNWTEIGSGIAQYSYIYEIGVNENSLICGINQRGIYKYDPDSALWFQSNAGLINENVSDMMLDGDEMLSVTVRNDFGQIFKTDDNGAYWNLWNNGCSDFGYNVLINTGSYYLAGSDGDFLYRSADKGENWEKISYPEFPATYISSFCLKDGVVFAGSFGNVIDAYRSTDHGANWTGCDLPGEGNVMALLATDEFVYAGRSDGVFRSDDLGLSWIKTSDGMSDYPFIKKFAANNEYLFAAANDGLYRSADHGEQWEKVFYPPFSEQIQSISTHEDYLFAGAKQLGLMISQDNGETWETNNPDFFQDPSGFYPTVNSIEIKGDTLYAAYQNYSIWLRPMPDITTVDDRIIGKNDSRVKVFPNPVNSNSTVSYLLPSSSHTTLKVYNILGHEMMELVREHQRAGEHTSVLNAEQLNAGIYFVVLQSGSTLSQQRIVVTD